ncbi:MAG: hypothetical protein NTW54_03355, partial [Bacteroidetes bacterium]|nr:hypothetical protein [Bacteroidota bacterium]
GVGIGVGKWHHKPNGVAQRHGYLPVVGDAEPSPWPTPNNGGGIGVGKPMVRVHYCITTPTGLHNNSHR